LMYDERLNLVTQSSLSCLTWKTYSLWIKYLCFDSLLSGLVVCWPRHRHGRTPHQLEASEAKGLPSIPERAPLRQNRAARRLVWSPNSGMLPSRVKGGEASIKLGCRIDPCPYSLDMCCVCALCREYCHESGRHQGRH
jgi:hypothetical protein